MRPIRLRYMFGFILAIISLSACQPSVTPTPNPVPSVIPTEASDGLSITAADIGSGVGLPAGASTSFSLTLNYPPANPPQNVIWSVQAVPEGITAEIVGDTAPFQRRLIITSDGSLAAGTYTVAVTATLDANQFARTNVQVTTVVCTETASGSSTQNINSNLVELITAGKPAVEHGLLVPLQICGTDTKHLNVKLTSAKADDGSTMTTPPAFYVYRSQVWPAPGSIMAHGLAELLNVQTPVIATASNGQLDADVPPGLYLLIFEHDRFGVTLTPQSTPASVTYDLKIG